MRTASTTTIMPVIRSSGSRPSSPTCKETAMTQTQPQFQPGDRFWTHYDYQWGVVVKVDTTYRDQKHGVTGDPLPDTTWYEVKYDNGATSLLDDAHGNWDMARMVPPHIAKRYGYGDDPNPVR